MSAPCITISCSSYNLPLQISSHVVKQVLPGVYESQTRGGTLPHIQNTTQLTRQYAIAEGPKRFAVVGGGLAGVAVAWNLLAMTGGEGPTSIDLFDAVGLAGGLF